MHVCSSRTNSRRCVHLEIVIGSYWTERCLEGRIHKRAHTSHVLVVPVHACLRASSAIVYEICRVYRSPSCKRPWVSNGRTAHALPLRPFPQTKHTEYPKCGPSGRECFREAFWCAGTAGVDKATELSARTGTMNTEHLSKPQLQPLGVRNLSLEVAGSPLLTHQLQI